MGAISPSTVWIGGPVPPSEPATPDPALEDAGITVGEFTGCRIWRVQDGWLRSVAMDHVWAPDEPMEGKPEGYAGVHAWKTLSLALQYGMVSGSAAYGRVALWGDIIEHEDGWRAQYAKILSIDGLLGSHRKGTLERLRRRYGVGGDENAEPESDTPEMPPPGGLVFQESKPERQIPLLAQISVVLIIVELVALAAGLVRLVF